MKRLWIIALLSSVPFFSPLAQNSIFTPAVNYPVGSNPWFIATADLNNDGKLDLVTPNRVNQNVSILFNNGNGTFAPAINYPAGSDPISIFAADFDNDSNIDLAVANELSNNFTILKNTGNGVFAAPVVYSAGIWPISIFASNINNDGYSDIVVTNFSSNNVSIFFNAGDGTFLEPINYPVGVHPNSVRGSDLDGDSHIDLAVTNLVSNSVSILINNGDGTFQPAANYDTGIYPYNVSIAYLDNDLNYDLAISNGETNNVSILNNNGNGTFRSAVNYAVGQAPYSVCAIDLNNDGNKDLAVANFTTNDISVLLNNGNAIFINEGNYDVGTGAHSVVGGDFDLDGDADLAVANWGSNNVSVLRNLTIDIDNGLIAHWNFDEGSGNILHDISGNGLDGTIYGANWTPGISGNALDFDGTDDYVDFGDIFNDLYLPVTVSGWVFYRGTSTYTTIINTDDQKKYYGLTVRIAPSTDVLPYRVKIDYMSSGDPDQRNRRSKKSELQVPLNQWSHIAVVISGPTAINIYINGIEAGGQYSGSGGPMLHSDSPARMAVFHQATYPNRYTADILDDIRIYDRELSPDEIVSLYELNSSLGSISGLITESDGTTPISGVLVRAMQNGSEVVHYTTGADCQYTLANLPAGTYTVAVSKFGYVTQNPQVELLAGQNITRNFQLLPAPNASRSGIVHDARTGNSLSDVLIEFLQDDIVRYSTTSEAPDGHYELDDIYAGDYYVRYSKVGYQTQTIQMTINPGWDTMPLVSLIQNGYVSAQPLKDAMNEFGSAYRNYLDAMGNVIVSTLAYQYQLMALSQFSEGERSTKKALNAATASFDDLTKYAAMVNSERKWTTDSPSSFATFLAWGAGESLLHLGKDDYLQYFNRDHLPWSNFKDKRLVIFGGMPPGNRVHSINEVVGWIDPNSGNELPNCVRQDFPINAVVDKLRTMRSRLMVKTPQSPDLPPNGIEDFNWIMPGSCDMLKNRALKIGTINESAVSIRDHFNENMALQGVTIQVSGVCGAPISIAKNILSSTLRFFGGGISQASSNVLSGPLSYALLTCNLGKYTYATVSTIGALNLTVELNAFIQSWPREFSETYLFYKTIKDEIGLSAPNPDNLNCSAQIGNTIGISSIPDICIPLPYINATVTGQYQITNESPDKTAKARLYGNLYVAQNESGDPAKRIIVSPVNSDEVEISPQSQAQAPFEFEVPARNWPFGHDSYKLDLTLVTSAGLRFFEATPDVVVLDPLCRVKERFTHTISIIGGRISQGAEAIGNIVSGQSSIREIFRLNFEGSDVDLHLYDDLGNHVGRNYETGNMDLQIAGAVFYGDSTNCEIIEVPSIPGQPFQIKVFGASVPDSESYSVDLTEILQSGPQPQYWPDTWASQVLPGDSVTITGEIFDRAGQSSYPVSMQSFSNLADSSGNQVSTSNWDVQVSGDVTGNQGSTISLHGAALDSLPLGIYTGVIVIQAQDSTFHIPVRMDVLSRMGVIKGNLYSIDSSAVSGANIVVIGTDKTSISDSSGCFILNDIRDGIYALQISHPAYRDTTLIDITVYPGDTTSVTITMTIKCSYIIGDANNSHTFTGLDVTYSVRYFKGGPLPPYSCECTPGHTWYVSGDVNGTCSFTGLDVTYMIRYFKGGAAPIPCHYCPPPPLLAPPAPGEEPTPAVQPVLSPTLKVKPKAGSAE